jgi:ComEC/Rec2-related protein
MSVNLFIQRFRALLLFFLDYKVLVYCFTILTLSIVSSNLLEGIIFYEDSLNNFDFFFILFPTLLLGIFFVVSYWLFLHVNFFGTFFKISIVSTFFVMPFFFFNFRSILLQTRNSESFTGKDIWIGGVVTSQEKDKSFLFDSGKQGFGKSLIRFKEYPVLHAGQRCKLKVNVVEPKSFDDFDYKKYLFRKGIYTILEVYEYQCVNGGNIALEMRYRLERIVEKSVSEPEASLLIGIMFGSKRVFQEDFNKALNSSGVSHIVSASGYNVALVSEGIEAVSKRFSGKGVILFKIVGIWLFTIFAGLGISLIRASFMMSLYLIALLFGRESHKGICLLLCITALLMFNPFLIHDVGFLFSLSSSAGLIFFSRCFKDIKWKFVESNILPTLTCILFTLPISLAFFGKVSLISILSNSIVVPIINSTIFWGLGITFLNIFLNLKPLFIIPYIQLNIFKSMVFLMSKVEMVSIDINVSFLTTMIYVFLFLFCLFKYPVSSPNYYLINAKRYER